MKEEIPWIGKKEFAPNKTIIIRSLKDWPKGVGIIKQIGKNIVVDGRRQWRLSGKNMPGKCDQNEKNQPLIRIKVSNFILKNFEISESKNGLTCHAENVEFSNLVFSKICEDALNPMRAKNVRINNCFFTNAQDKTIQCNYCENVVIEKNVFNTGINSIRLMGSTSESIKQNIFNNVDTAIQVTKKGSLKIDPLSNDFYNVRTRFKTEEGGSIIFLE